jgi:polysaccharide deacetylase 2 family uncharacterized protein YibQ
MGHNKPVPATAGHIDMDVEDDEEFRRRMRVNVAMAKRQGQEFAIASRVMRRETRHA